MRAFFLFFTALVLSSCESMLVEKEQPYSPNSARLLFYVHSTSTNPPDIDFTISDIEIETLDGRFVPLLKDPVTLYAKVLGKEQVLISEAFAQPGTYKGLRIGISRASIKRDEGRASLKSPDKDYGLMLSSRIDLKAGESRVVSLAWDPTTSVEKAYKFRPAITIEEEYPSSRGLLLFISNSGSNYISVIDRSLERVTGAISVEQSPTGMALNSAQDLLYAVNSDSRTVSVIDTAQLRTIYTIPLNAGLKPVEVVFVPDSANSIDGKLYVINRLSNDVTVVATSTRRVIKTVPVGTFPSAIAADTNRKEVYVTNERSNSVSVISTVDNSVLATIPVDKKPTGMILGKDKLYVMNEGSFNISVISLAQRKVASTIILRDPPRKGLRAFDGRLFTANTGADSISFISSQEVVTRTIPGGDGPIGVAGDEKRNKLYIPNFNDGTVSVAEPIGEMLSKRIYVGRNPYGVVLLDR